MRRPNPTVSADDALAVWNAVQRADVSDPITAECTLTTPMYGGGIQPGVLDCELPVRTSSLRGQLRFWWRLLNDDGRDPRDLFRAESALWGGISGTGPRVSHVVLRVCCRSVGSADTVKAKDRRFPAYAFILERGQDPFLLANDFEFTLTLRFTADVVTNQRDQVIEALRWWASFGGAGARTRRGLGTVRVTSRDVELKPVSREEVQSRGGRMVLQAPSRDPIEAWKLAVETLKSFRQGTNVSEGRNPGGGGRPGRSRWPEPDAIRRLTRNWAPGHKPQLVDGYPRAAFGLPIVFQFKNANQGDPKGPKGKGLTLNPDDGDRGDRMASPLIVRPYFDGARYCHLALLLPGWEERVSVSVALDSERVGPAWPRDPDERARRADLITPMRGRGRDALTAFMHYFEQRTATDRGGQRAGGR